MYKYVLNGGLAFSEEADMKRLRTYASKGWILEGLNGLFYKLRKDQPQNIDYTLDYQAEADDEYFNLFIEAGWTPVVSVGGEIHIFSAPEGTKPIYSDPESIIDKYDRTRKQFGVRSLYSFIAVVLSFMAYTLVESRPVSLAMLVLSTGVLIYFIFCFMPYLAYYYRVRRLKM